MSNDGISDLTDLSEQLNGEQAMEIAHQLRSRLDQLGAELGERVAKGLPLGQLEPFQDVLGALAAARSIVVRASLLAERKARSNGTSS